METGRAAEQGIEIGKLLRQAAVLAGGGFLLMVGVVMLVLPGPGLAVIIAGLGVLATEYTWARRWLDKGRSMINSVRNSVRSRFRFSSAPARVAASLS